MVNNQNYLAVEEFSRIPWLVHGFGLAGFDLESLKLDFRLADFQPVEMKQEHSTRVLVVDRPPDRKVAGDALITPKAGLLLVVKTADCLPIFLVDTEHQLVAAVHGGWRGTAGRIAETAFETMRKSFSTRPDQTLAALGPAIEARCYEVGQEVYDFFLRQGFPPDRIFLPGDRAGQFFLDLKAANFWLLSEVLGLQAENIFSLELCTFCRPDLLSHRRQPDDQARLINFIGIKD
ncbi:MAG TPA: peptidoglycan editing factor PgeF [Candidatus Saccharicenans sp.]|jgi:YfiH family protein|nr:peptidoglycan editing factor PgeF [Candidatus Saccharicenans sp.]HRD01851.1 peptidoglycan editing factor PgeF [Candidatus Saccharicenans sp.]